MHELRSTILSGEARQASLVARKAKAEGAAAGGLSKIAIKRQEARITNQRLEDRLPGIVESTTMIFRRRRQDIAVVNVSSRGAMIRGEIDPRIGEKLDLLFDGKNRTKCIVRWVRQGRVGLEFVNETILWTTDRSSGPVFQPEKAEAPAIHAVAEREPRQKLLRAGTLYWSGISIPVRLRNISGHGARVESGRELCPGSEVELDLGEAGFQIAEVRWSKDGQVGLRFAQEFDIESLAPSQQAERPPELLKPAYLETELQPDSPWAARFEKLSLTDLKPVEGK
ncbi:MAG TPA: PilZ domain-containing protein [Allosphingosinicella sp.]|nr:PilZ domain-containing protein [Allosphingosinicella sp.]